MRILGLSASRFLLILVFVMLSLVPVRFFLLNRGNPAFVLGAMGNWFATVLGVLGAGVIAYEIARAQVFLQTQKEAETSARQRLERSLQLTTRLLLELTDNDARVGRLQAALVTTTTSRNDIWDWVLAIADGISTSAYVALQAEGLASQLPTSEPFVHIAYDMLRGLTNRIREGRAAHVVLLGFKGDQEEADKELSFVTQLAREVKRRTEEASGPLRTDQQVLSKRLQE